MQNSERPPDAGPWTPKRWEWTAAILIGVGLSVFVWRGLVTGGGLVGGDTYTYFYPQKQVLAEAYHRGELALWHDRTSLGYPLLAESQAGVLYPPNQVLYRLFDVHNAGTISLLFHYAAAFVFAWRFCRSQRLSFLSALLAAMVFVYGWFPVRVSLEWSYIGAVWFPLSLWMTERWLQRPTGTRFATLSICLAVQMLAGHFTLAFITQLTCLGFAFLSSSRRLPVSAIAAKPASGTQPNSTDNSSVAVDRVLSRWHASLTVIGAVMLAALLASIQLVPTLELRQLSQRDGAHSVFNPSDGHMPPMYLTQMIASWWYWHTPELAASRERLKHAFLLSSGDTNPVEAHLYIGLIPLLLLTALCSSRLRRFLRDTRWSTWLILSVAGILYSFGWFVPLFRHLPGFGYFIGPGRYTIITTLGFAIVAGLGLDGLLRRRRFSVRLLITGLIAVVTLPDLLKSAEYPVSDAQLVEFPPLKGLEESWIASTLQQEDKKSPVRLIAGGANVANLFGVSSAPAYLGLGPAEYFSEETTVATQPASVDATFPSDTQLRQWKSLAVTHVLTTEPVENPSADLELVNSGPDTFLNRVWGRGAADCFLYRIRTPRSRVSAQPDNALIQCTFLHRGNSVEEFEIELKSDATVEFCDLMYPGWNVEVDGMKAAPESQSGIGRRVKVAAGRHRVRWIYAPASFRLGWVISLAASVVTGVCCLKRR